MANLDAGKAGANDDADDKSKQSANNTDDAASGKNAADKNKSDNGKSGDSNKSKQIVFESQDDLDRVIQKRLDRQKKEDDEKATLSKEQLLEKERDDARKELRVSNARDAFIEKSGIRDYAKATKLFRMYSNELEFDDAGKISNLADVIKSAKTDWPELFGKVQPGTGDLGAGKDGDSKPAGSQMNNLLRQATGRKN